MKIKLMIALVILALVFGMSFTACDDGASPAIKEGDKETIHDIKLLKATVDENGNITAAGNTTDSGRIWYNKNDEPLPDDATPDPDNGDYWKYGLSDWGKTPERATP